MNPICRAVAALLYLSCAADAAQCADTVRTPVPDARPVLLAALQSSTGAAYGVLIGETADAITRHFQATSPIYIDVSTEKRYQQPGCSRLKVLFWQEGVRLPDVPAPRKQTIEFSINYCLDGLPPKSLS